MNSFEIRTHGKWILAGEHSVLRGCQALVFPLLSRALELTYLPNKRAFNVDFNGEHGEELQLLFFGVLEKACQLSHKDRSEITGELKLKSSIPVGAGLGASAALSVAVARWFLSQKWILEKEIYEFARNLENLFHGESSGVDIAVALSNQGLIFKRPNQRLPFEIKWQPKLYISYSGQRGVTLDCVNQVKALIASDKLKGDQIDSNMAMATDNCLRALSQNYSEENFDLLKSAIDQAAECFEKWNLIPNPSREHMKWLREQGAIAVKPTGSGGGGYTLSLWRDAPQANLQKKLISCF
jgi:mevalonate kinase